MEWSLLGFLLVALLVSCEAANCTVGTRLDCHPEPMASQATCIARGCCWAPADTTGEPFCFYGADWGYSLSQVKDTPTGFTGALTLSGPSSHYGPSLKNVQLDVFLETNSRVRFTITDPANKRYQVPIATPTPTGKAPAPIYAVEHQNSPFGLKITRSSTQQAVFDSTIGGLTFADQFLQISTSLTSKNVYGLGEHITPMNLDDLDYTTYSLFARDQGTPQGPTNLYGTFPFFINMEADGSAHGVFLLNSNAMDVVVQHDAVTFRSIGGIIDMYILMGPTPADVVRQFTDVVGRPFMPPYWGLGFHLCRWGYGSVARTKQINDAMRSAGIPQDTQWNDIDYMDNHLDFTFDPQKFGDLPKFVDDLHAQGQRYIMIVDPGISSTQGSGNYLPFDEGIEMDVFVKDSDGQPLIGKVWPGLTTYPDFFHPNCSKYWDQQIKRFYDQVKFDGLWIDMNEPSNFVEGDTKGCPSSPLETPPYLPGIKGDLKSKTLCMTAQQHVAPHYDVHSLYGLSEMVATMASLKSTLGKRTMVISRSTYPSAGLHGGHWLGDNTAQWSDLYFSIPGMLNFNMYGIPLVGPDICGFGGTTTEELCIRWMEVGAFYPFSRNHNTIGAPDQDPTSMGPRLQAVSRRVLMARYELLPFLYTLFHQAHVNGTTVARPLFFEFPGDTNTLSIDKQFLWGASLLVSPVLEKGATTVDAYLPKALWYDLFTGIVLSGESKQVTLPAPLETINVHVRGGSVLPTQEPALTTTASRQNAFGLLVAPDASGAAAGEAFIDDGDSLDTYESGAFSTLIFSAEVTSAGGHVTSSVVHHGAGPSPPLGKIHVLGVPAQPTKVAANGHPITSFSYDGSSKALLVSNLTLPFVNATVTLTWSM